jgi:hypothetical protein
MAEPQTPKAPFKGGFPHAKGARSASMPSSNTHSGGGAPQQIKAGVNKGRTGTYEAGKPGRGRGKGA